MKVFLATAADKSWSRILRDDVANIADRDRFGEHILVDDPDAADLVLLVDAHQHLADWTMRALRTTTYVRTHPGAVFVYDERDAPRDSLPGLYVSMPRRGFDDKRHRAIGYYGLRSDTRSWRGIGPDLLFSFQGRRLAGVRESICALTHPRAVVEDTSRYDFFGGDERDLASARMRYREILGRSKFVLCPRGTGTSSFRLFEALACARVPVILSDDWVEPQGIDWGSCSVRVPERDASSVATRLESLETSWSSMSAAAAGVYDSWFAPEVWFHRAIEYCRELQEGGAGGLSRQWLTRPYWRDGARQWKHALVDRSRR